MIKAINLSQKTVQINPNKEIARGGEGRIIMVKDGLEVAKIFHQELPITLRAHFDFLMKLSNDLFLSPTDILFVDNTIIGYLMPFLGADFVPISQFFLPSFCQKNGIDLPAKRKLVEQLNRAIKQTHAHDIVIGDMNPYNIMVNVKSLEIKIIDTDSFETPHRKHTGLMLEDIRDYLKQGKVNKQSDYFAYSILVFNLLTYTHPFKGIHPIFKSVRERMIQQLPIYHEDVKKPKCFIQQPKEVQLVFDDFYLKGDRYMPDFISGLSGDKIFNQVDVSIMTDELQVLEILHQTMLDADFNRRWGVVKTKTSWLIYEAVEKSKIILRKTYALDRYDKVFLAENSVIAVKTSKWFFDIQANEQLVKNIQLSGSSPTYNYDGILVLLAEDALFKLFLDEIKFSQLRMERVEAFTEGVRAMQSFVQHAGGTKNIFYRNKQNISTILINENIIIIYQKGAYAFYSKKENNIISHKFVSFDGLKMVEQSHDLELLTSFAVQPLASGRNLLFFCQDNYLEVRDASTFQEIAKFAFDGVSAQSEIFSSIAGLIISEGEHLFLVNKK